jgi:hypothetical protein
MQSPGASQSPEKRDPANFVSCYVCVWHAFSYSWFEEDDAVVVLRDFPERMCEGMKRIISSSFDINNPVATTERA